MNRLPRSVWAGLAVLAVVPALAVGGVLDLTDPAADPIPAGWQVVADVLPPPAPIERAGSVTAPAVRSSTTVVVAPPSPPPPTAPAVVVGPAGLPLAPAGLSGCDEMNWYRLQWGLPDRFSDQPRQPASSFASQGLGWRESNCRNDVTSVTGCCHGYWQLYSSLHLRDHRLAPRYQACGIRHPLDVLGTSPASKQMQACAARALYDVVGLQGWAL